MNLNISLVLILCFCNLAYSDIFDTGKSWLNFASNSVSDLLCTLSECCNHKTVPYKPGSLKHMLNTKLFGQHMASDIVLNAINSHLKNTKPQKPLVMSFHGANGVGKTYVSRMIAKAFYEKGDDSKFFHFYYGLDNFPSVEKTSDYQAQLRYDIESAINKCEKSLFVFDGVDQMPPGLLNVLMPFIDCTNCAGKIKKNKLVFILLTNSGSLAIEKQLLKKMREGVSRESTTVQDFEKIIKLETHNLTRGLYNSLMIQADAIDFYVPFLPLEKKHVRKCVIEAFEERNLKDYSISSPTSLDLIDQVFQELLWGPEPENFFAISGCKRVSQITGRISSKLMPNFDFFNEDEEKAHNKEL